MRRPALRMSPNARMLSLRSETEVERERSRLPRLERAVERGGGELDTVKDANQLFLDGNASG